jgi:outer membrane protein TolC
LAQNQYQDIQAKARAGMASRKDALSSHLAVLSHTRQLQAAQTDLTMALRDLDSLLNSDKGLDASQPWYLETNKTASEKSQTATVLVALDPLDQSLARLEKNAALPVDPRHPQAQLFLQMAQAAEASAESLASGHWPKVQLIAKSSLDYPNGPIAEQIQQNTLGAKASWSIWEANRIVKQTEEKAEQAQAQEKLAENAMIELTLAWQKAKDKLLDLENEQPVIDKMVEETTELSHVAYASYEAGRADYIEVQAANLQALEANTQAALNKAQRLIQLAMLESLSSDKE